MVKESGLGNTFCQSWTNEPCSPQGESSPGLDCERILRIFDVELRHLTA